MPAGETQSVLRQAFAKWGLPQRIRVDNGIPWGSRGEFPTDLALWLTGLGVHMIWNPPRCPQKNGVVERSQGTAKRWTEPSTCPSAEQLQQRVSWCDRLQREFFPVGSAPSRLARHPQLQHSGRSYSRETEEKHWSLEPVLAHLAQYAVRRRVDRSGTISLYNRTVYLGAMHKGRDVYVTVDPQTAQWLVADEHGCQIARPGGCPITSAQIRNLQVTHRRLPKQEQTQVAISQAKPHDG